MSHDHEYFWRLNSFFNESNLAFRERIITYSSISVVISLLKPFNEVSEYSGTFQF